MSESGHHTLITLKENSFSIFSLVLVLLAFLLTAWMAWLNYSAQSATTAQMLRAQAHVQDQYTEFLNQAAANQRFEKAFEIKQRHYAEFMGAVSDVWLAVSRGDKKLLEDALHIMRKASYGLEPFLDGGGRHYLDKRMDKFEHLSNQLIDPQYQYKQNEAADRKTLNEMSDEFQTFLYPLLFEPEEGQEPADETAKTGE